MSRLVSRVIRMTRTDVEPPPTAWANPVRVLEGQEKGKAQDELGPDDGTDPSEGGSFDGGSGS